MTTLPALLWLLACTFGTATTPPPGQDQTAVPEPASPPAARATARTLTAFPFGRRADLATLELPPSTRPDGAPAPEKFAPFGTFELDRSNGRADIYKTPLPVQSILFLMREKGTDVFGYEAPPGLHVYGPDGTELKQKRSARTTKRYAFDRDFLYVAVDAGAPAPDASEYSLTFDKATLMENSLNLASSNLKPKDFAFRGITLEKTAHSGMFLPAPGRATWADVTVPEKGVIGFRGTILSPAIKSAQASDGAKVKVVVTGADGVATEAGAIDLRPEEWVDPKIDLSTWAGQKVRVSFLTEPGATPTFDYVFLEEPTLYTPSEHPSKVLIVLVDALRRDHVGFYGYPYPTTPKLDAWAKHAAVFEDARTVAPWTLPAVRSMFTGAQPEQWFNTPQLASRLADAGFETEAIVTNAFLSQTFDMQEGWSRHGYFHRMPAQEVKAHALEAIRRNADRDFCLLLHVMEAHLPYGEPAAYQNLFAGPKPASLQKVSRHALQKVDPASPEFKETWRYVNGRYDQNIKVVDDEMAEVIAVLGPDATVVFVSDHGEEFWDHGGFEHGHAFGDELLRVPLAIRSPGLQEGRVSAPVSLLDVTPTILDLMGLPHDAPQGYSTAPLTWHDAGSDKPFVERPRAFGRPLYDPRGNSPAIDGWGVVTSDQKKWYSQEGKQHLYDLLSDETEQKDLAADLPLASYPQALATGLGREVVPVWRVTFRTTSSPTQSDLELSFPGGIAAAWNSYHPHGEYEPTYPVVEGTAVHLAQAQGNPMPQAIYVRPTGDARSPAGLAVKFTGADGVAASAGIATAAGKDPVAGLQKVNPAPTAPLELAPQGNVVLTAGDANWAVFVELVWMPMPEGVEVKGFDAEMRQQLEELGYLQAEPPNGAKPADDADREAPSWRPDRPPQ